MSRLTRSRTIPSWTLQETLTLVLEIAAVDGECGSVISSHQKWEIVAENLAALSCSRRSSSQCRSKWASLLSEYEAIRRCSSSSGLLTGGEEGELPGGFDRELYGLIDDVMAARRKGKEKVEVEGAEDMGFSESVNPADSHKEIKDGKAKGIILERLQEKAACIEENVMQIEAILRGDLSEDTRISCNLKDLRKPNAMETAFKLQQANELVKVFGSLVATLDQIK